MEINRDPLAYFITWTVYGTFLQGDGRWWRKKRKGSQSPQPRLEEWHRDRLRHEIILLSEQHRDTVKSEIQTHCEFRQWQLWIANPRTNHVHVVISARGFVGDVVRDQLKANCTRGLPRGSFGLELTRADNDDLFVANELADTLAHVTRLVDAAARSDEDFAAELDEAAPRVVQNLKSFLEVIAKGKAGLRLESGDFRCAMTPIQASNAFNRVAETTASDETVRVNGVFKGVLLESWEFDFSTDGHEIIAGKIDDNLTEEQVIAFNRSFFNERSVATLVKTTVVFRNGRVRASYRLSNVEPLT